MVQLRIQQTQNDAHNKRKELLDCDDYRYLKDGENKKKLFHGECMGQYSFKVPQARLTFDSDS